MFFEITNSNNIEDDYFQTQGVQLTELHPQSENSLTIQQKIYLEATTYRVEDPRGSIYPNDFCPAETSSA